MTHEPNMIEYLYAQRLRRAAGLATYKNAFIQSYKYAEFLESTPKLGDYVATNEDGVVMEKPEDYYAFVSLKEPPRKNDEKWMNECEEYSEALDRVLWKGWEVREQTGYCILILIGNEEPGGQISERYTDKKEWTWYDKTTYKKLINSGVKLERIQRK